MPIQIKKFPFTNSTNNPKGNLGIIRLINLKTKEHKTILNSLLDHCASNVAI